MNYIYGEFTDRQISEAVREMHHDIHKLLRHKDKYVEDTIFETNEDFLTFFKNVLLKLGGTKTLFNDNGYMVMLMSTLQAAYNNAVSNHFNYKTFRKAILDSHGYIKLMFEKGGESDAKSGSSEADFQHQK